MTTRELWAEQSLKMRWVKASQNRNLHTVYRIKIREIGRELMSRTNTSHARRATAHYQQVLGEVESAA